MCRYYFISPQDSKNPGIDVYIKDIIRKYFNYYEKVLNNNENNNNNN
jgi:hypothetical protein